MSRDWLRQSARSFNETPDWKPTTRGFKDIGKERAAPVFTPEEIGEFYDANNRVITDIHGGAMHCGYWDGPDDHSGMAEAALRMTDIMIGKLRIGPGAHVLDLGCGTGAPAVRLARVTGARVTGLSVSAADVAQANALAAAEGVSDLAEFALGDMMELPFPPDSFDAVLAIESFTHISDRRQALRQAARVLRPGGRIALTDFIVRAELPEEERIALGVMNEAWRVTPPVRAEEYKGFCRYAGLSIDEITDVTDHTKYTTANIFAGLAAYAPGQLPPGMATIWEYGEDYDWSQAEKEPQTEGVVIVVAHRPGRLF